MTEVERTLRRIVNDLTEEQVSFALIGGLAISIRAEPRLTRDADFAISVKNDSMAEQTIRNLSGRGYVPGTVVEHASGRLAAVRLSVPESDVFVTDLLFASSGIEPEIVMQAEELEVLADFRLRVASIGHLIATKLLARDDRLRPADADDLRALAAVARDEDWAEARTAVNLIAQRGFARGKDLATELDRLLNP